MRQLSYKTVRRLDKIFTYVVAAIVSILFCFPLFWMISSSLKPIDQLFTSPPLLFPQTPTLMHYKELLQITNFPTYFMNSSIVAVATVFITIVIAALGGYSIARFRYPGSRLLPKLNLFVYMFPPILLCLPLMVILSNLRLTNTRIGLILSYLTITLPFSLWLLQDFVKAIPIELEEAAMIDGASRLRAFLLINLPLMLPGIIAAGIFTFITAWNEYLYALVFIVSERLKVLPIGVAMFAERTYAQWELIMAAAVLITIPIVVLFMFIQKHLIVGMGAGAVKE